MIGRVWVAVGFVVLVSLAGCSVGYQPAGEPTESVEPAGDAELGEYGGYWYNDTLDINPATGLTEPEQEAVLARSMARVQWLRGLPFQDPVEIEIIDREEFRDEYDLLEAQQHGEERSVLDNAQHELLFVVGNDRDVGEVREENFGSVVLGFYEPEPGQITIVSESSPPTLQNELTLGHELVHALQDQHFNLSSLDGGTLDESNARDGLIEGDAGVVERAYQQRCVSGEWACIDRRQGPVQLSPSASFHRGLYFVEFFPYAEGPSFIDYHREREGWSAINAMYEEVPVASAAVINPETYGSEQYGSLAVTDRSEPEWDRVQTAQLDHATVGQAGLASIFAYTAFEDPERGVITQGDFQNIDQNGDLERQRPYTYDVPYTMGWAADRLDVYTTDDEQIGVVWTVQFNDAENATAFRTGYERVIQYWGGQVNHVNDDATWWTIGEESAFTGALWVHRDDNTVTVVKAPQRDALSEVYGTVDTAV